MPDTATIKQLLEAGAHFGHQVGRWHPHMKTYIFTKRNGIHIIDLEQTASMLDKACDFIREVAAESGKILFVGTKKQAQESIEQEAQRCGKNRFRGCYCCVQEAKTDLKDRERVLSF